MKIKCNPIHFIMALLGSPLIFACFYTNNYILSTICTLVYWGVGLIFSLKNFNQHVALFSFDACFFVFLIGGYLFELLQTGTLSFFSNNYFTSSENANCHAIFCLFLSMYTVNITYILVSENIDSNCVILKKRPESPNAAALQFLKIVVLITFICKLIETFSQVLLVRTVTYYASWSYASTVSSIFSSVGSLFYPSLFLFWATMPKIKEFIYSLILLALIVILLFFSGDRGDVVSLFMSVIMYITMRNWFGLKDIVIKKKTIVAFILLLPIIVFALQAMSHLRNNEKYDASIADGIADFTISQGGSVKIIANSYDLHDKIESMGGNTFVLGEIRYYLKHNIVARLFTGETKTLRTVDDAYSGDNFLRTYGYAYAPATYLRNVGSGSTYVAEVYHDGGYILLTLFNVLYALIFIKIDGFGGESCIYRAIILNIYRFIPLLPRGMALGWLTETFSVQNLVLYFIFFLLLRRANKN